MSEYTRQSGKESWANCLMTYHAHLVIMPGCEEGLRFLPGKANRRYIRHIYFKKGWWGYLWQEHFYSFPKDENYLLATVRYAGLNPVKAKMCSQ